MTRPERLIYLKEKQKKVDDFLMEFPLSTKFLAFTFYPILGVLFIYFYREDVHHLPFLQGLAKLFFYTKDNLTFGIIMTPFWYVAWMVCGVLAYSFVVLWTTVPFCFYVVKAIFGYDYMDLFWHGMFLVFLFVMCLFFGGGWKALHEPRQAVGYKIGDATKKYGRGR